ncbi:MAG: imm11 family protein [Polyangiaceae bacterium]
MFEPHAELLPLVGNDGLELFALNVTTVLDALDEERSSIQRFADTKTIMRIKKTVFRPTVVRDVDVFWLPHRASATYLSQRFVDAYAAAGLVGLEFRKVWSEAG